MSRPLPKDPTPHPLDPATAEVLTLAQAKERSRKLRIAQAIRQGTYKPDLHALASSLLQGGLIQGMMEED